jgi:hypothetical protein
MAGFLEIRRLKYECHSFNSEQQGILLRTEAWKGRKTGTRRQIIPSKASRFGPERATTGLSSSPRSGGIALPGPPKPSEKAVVDSQHCRKFGYHDRLARRYRQACADC